MVERAGAGRRPKEGFPTRVLPPFGDAGRKVEEPRQGPEVWDVVAVRGDARSRNGVQRGGGRWRDLVRQRDRLQSRVYFEGKGLVFPVQVMTAAADACGGVFGPGVISPRRLKAAVRHSGRLSGFPQRSQLECARFWVRFRSTTS